jgi:general secretion pathway protein L
MAHNVIGLDLGSNMVKAVVVHTTLRGSEPVRFECESVALDEDGNSSPEAVLQATNRLIDRLELLGGESIHCALPGEFFSIRNLELPSSARRRMEQVLKFEIDEILPFDIDDAVFDYVQFERSSESIRLVTTTILRNHVEDYIELLENSGVAPREIGVAPLSYWTALSHPKKQGDEIVCFVDIGHVRTNIAILDKSTPTARTFLRGSRDLTIQLAKAGGADFAKAEQFKRDQGISGKIGAVLTDSLKPLVREIQQTFKGHLAAGGKRVTKVLLAGGGSQLNGLTTFLANEVGVVVEHFAFPADKYRPTPPGTTQPDFAQAYALAFREELPRASRFDLRRGDLAFKGDFEFLKKRVGWIAICFFAIIMSWIFSTYAEYQVLADESEIQKALISKKTEQLFKKAILDPEKISDLLSPEKTEKAPIPKKDAFDLVVELSKRIPTTVVHDIDFLEIKSKRLTLRGVIDAELKIPGADSDGGVEEVEEKTPDAGETELSPTDLITQRLLQFSECFSSVRIGKVTAMGSRRKYQMDIDTRCP